MAESSIHRWSHITPARPEGMTVTRHHNMHRSPARCGLVRNTAEPSGELSAGDVVTIGEAALAVARPAGWTPVRGGMNEVRADEHGTRPLPASSRLPGSTDRTTISCPDQGAT